MVKKLVGLIEMVSEWVRKSKRQVEETATPGSWKREQSLISVKQSPGKSTFEKDNLL
ncbi:unnamed protein product [Linum tenue]|uniref:Uncharacterized protein n=1 Tax=Linum tenue TaxID=586396 RepID=A0AAV0J9C8_9ROSI|nr:unnamed protein product [Linum tenue]